MVTPYDDINTLLDVLLVRIRTVFHDNLVGLYLYGSLVSGDFDHDISDIDLLAVTSGDMSEKEFEALRNMHDDVVHAYKEWKERIEVQYISLFSLQTFKTQTSKIVTISPGEPIHFIKAGKDWLINWYIVQEKGLALFGPHQATIIPKISKDEYIAAVKEQALSWRERIKKYNSQSPRGSLAYVVFTLCRAMYGYKMGEQVSKKHAASWVAEVFPQWASLLGDATGWRDAQWDSEQKSIGPVLTKINEFTNFATTYILR